MFYSRLSKWDEAFDGLPVHRIQKQIWYPLGLQTLNHPAGGGAFVSDISATLASKLASIRAYQTQFPPDKDRVFRLVEGQGRMLGASAGFEAGELLISSTTLGLANVVETLCHGSVL
ncbi:MAG: hypothetical protein V9F00_13845 [Nocardioides sp.]